MTPNDDAYRLLSEYAAGNLTDAERNQLAKEALADPAVFEAMVEEEEWREALEDSMFRRRVKERLRELGAEREHYWTRVSQFLLSPKGYLSVGSAAATIAVAVLVQLHVIKPGGALIQVNLGPANGPAATAASIAGEPAASESSLETASRSAPVSYDASATLQLDRPEHHPVYRSGDRQRIGFRVEKAANVVLWEERADGASYRLFPNRYQSSSLVEAGKTMFVPPPGQGDLLVQGPPGARVLRLLVLPPDRDPLDTTKSWEELRGDAKEVRLVYEVKE